MSINELEAKARELRQLQALIDEAQAEAEALKDTIKAAMGDQDSIQAGGYLLQNRRHRPAEGPARRGRAVHQGDNHPPLLRGVSDILNIPGSESSRSGG